METPGRQTLARKKDTNTQRERERERESVCVVVVTFAAVQQYHRA